jgi:hypothetical protein
VTLPSGRHLGIYRSLVTAYCDSSGEFSEAPDLHSNDDDPQVPDMMGNDDTTSPATSFDPTAKEKAEAILQLIFGIAEAATHLGFYLQRWTQW